MACRTALDIQEELQNDIKRRPKAFPMVKKRNANIDHRRVKTLLPYFQKQWDLRSGDLDDKSDPWRPGDIVFMDTQIPVLDALIAMHILKEEGFTLQVVAFTAHASAIAHQQGLDAVMIAHLN